MTAKDIETFAPSSREAWRKWLQQHHHSKQSVWLVFYKKRTDILTITYSDAVDEALCFGWIDSKAKPLDEEKSMRFFCKRKPNSVWSKVNKEKVQRLAEEGLITQAGYKSIETAKENGSWIILDDVEELMIPKDLETAFKTKKGSKDFFLSLSKSVRKAILQWLVLAKRSETRQKRINEIVTLSAQKLKPPQF